MATQQDPSTAALNRSLSIATIIMMSSVLLSRIMGLVREQVLAGFGGTSFAMDAYVTAFLLPEMLNHFLAGGFLSITFIPIFQRNMLSRDPDKAWISFSNLLSVGTLLFLVAIPIMIFATPQMLGIMGPHIQDTEHLAYTVRLTRIILPAQLFFYWGAFFSAVQMAQHRFFLPALSPLCYNLGIILGGIILGPKLGVEGFAWGVLIGAFLGNVALQLPGAIKIGMKFRPSFNIFHPDLQEYIKKTIPLVLGLGMTFSNEIFFRFFGSFLPEGGTSSINYALRTTMMVVAVFGQASGVAFYPFLSRLAAEKQFLKMGELLNSVLLKIALFLIPFAAMMNILSRQIISLLFEHGRFTSKSTTETAGIFAIYTFGCFAFSASMIVARSFYAMQNTLLPMIISSTTAIITIPLYIVFSKIMGGKGIAAAAVIGMTLQFVVLYSIWCQKHHMWNMARNELGRFLKIIGITAIGALLCWFLKQWTSAAINLPYGLLNNGVTILAASIPSLVLIFLLYDLTGLQRIKESLRGLVKR